MYKLHKTKTKTTAVESFGVCKVHSLYTYIIFLLCVLAIIRMYKLHIILHSDQKLSLVILIGIIDYLFLIILIYKMT